MVSIKKFGEFKYRTSCIERERENFIIMFPLQVVLHDPYVFPDILSRAFVIKPGYETFVSVRLVKTESLPAPYEDAHCEDHTGKKLKYFKTYSRIECLSECMADYVIGECGCLGTTVVRK